MIPVRLQGAYKGASLTVMCNTCGILPPMRSAWKFSKKRQAQMHHKKTGHRVWLCDGHVLSQKENRHDHHGE